MRHQGRLMVSIGMCTIVLLAASCGAGADRASSVALTRLEVGAVPVAEAAILLDSAIFAKHGIALSVKTYRSGAVIVDALISGGVDLGYSNLLTPLISNSRDIPLRLIGPITIEDEQRARHRLVTRRGDSIAAFRRRKVKIAINQSSNIDHLLLLRWLDENAFDTSKVELKVIGFPQMLPALRAREVDAVAAVEPFVTIARRQPEAFDIHANYMAAKNSSEPTAVSGFLVHAGWLAKHEDVAASLERALFEAMSRATEDPVGHVGRVARITLSDSTTIREMPPVWYAVDSTLSDLTRLEAVAAKYGFIGKRVDVSKLNRMRK